jgi:hypothetical protein
VADANGNQTNREDYAYHNALPGTTPGASATGVVDPSVIVAGGSAPGAHPYTDMVGNNGMRTEASQATLNPAFAPTEEAAHGQDAQQQAALSAAQDAGLAPGDASNPAATHPANPAGGGGDNHNAQLPLAPVITSAVAGAAGHATVNWTAPVDPDGYGITGYELVATSSDGGAPVTLELGNVLTRDVAGLTSTKHYTFKVAAKNIAGTGAQSAASASVLIG